jgi:hypothetical protein
VVFQNFACQRLKETTKHSAKATSSGHVNSGGHSVPLGHGIPKISTDPSRDGKSKPSLLVPGQSLLSWVICFRIGLICTFNCINGFNINRPMDLHLCALLTYTSYIASYQGCHRIFLIFNPLKHIGKYMYHLL